MVKLTLSANPRVSVTVSVIVQVPLVAGAVQVARDCDGLAASVPGCVSAADMVPHAAAGTQLKLKVAVWPASGSWAVAERPTCPPCWTDPLESAMPSMSGLALANGVVSASSFC
jgi:hypothetical protein